MLKTLIKVRLRSLLSSMFGSKMGLGSGKKRGPLAKVLFALLILYLVAALFFSMGMYFDMMARPFYDMGLGWLYFALGGLMAVVLCFVGSIFITQNQLFTARDNELLLSMPIPPGYILMSRMITLLALNYLYTVFIMLPCIVLWIIRVGFSPGAFIAFVVAVLFLPLISLALSCVCGWVIGLVTSRLRKSNLVTTVLFIGFFAAYMYFFMKLQGYLGTLIESGAAVGDAVRRALPPLYWFGRAATGDFVSLLLFLLCCILPFALVYWLIARSFITILTTKKGAARIKYRARAMKVSGSGSALLRRELLRFFGTPLYVFNAGFGAVMHLLLAGALVIQGPGLIAMLLNVPDGGDMSGLLAALACIVVSFCSLMVIPSSASISLEGRNLWIVKSAPVTTGQIFRAKAGVNLIVAVPTGLVASLACLWVIPMGTLEAVTVVLLPVAVSLYTALFGLSANLLLPRLDWVNEAVVIKQSGSALIAVFGGMATLALPVILYIVALNGLVPLDIYLLICLAALLLLSGGLLLFLKGRGKRLFEALS